MAKRKKTSFWAIAATALVTAAAAIGAVKLFGVPDKLLPEDEKVMECIGTVTMDDFLENSKYRKSSDPTYGDSYTLELFEYTLDSKEDIELRLLNYIDEDGNGLKERRVIQASGPRGAGFTILNSKVHYVEMDYYSTEEREIQTFKGMITYAGDGTSYMHIFGFEQCHYSQHIQTLNSAVDNLEEIVSVSFYRFKNDPIEIEETEITNKVTIDLSYDDKEVVELDEEALLDLLNGNRRKDIFKSKGGIVIGLQQGYGGLYSETGEFNIGIDNSEHEFNRAKIVVGNIDNVETTIDFNGQNSVLYVDYEDSDNELKTEVYLSFDEKMDSLSFDGTSANVVIYSITLWNETPVEEVK